MTEAEHTLRMRAFEIGRHLRDMVLDEHDAERLGRDLIDASGVCENCRGTGQDGDPPDAAGVGGGTFACEKCQGHGVVKRVAKQRDIAEVRERIRDYLGNGGLFNPEMMEHDKVRNLLLDIAAIIDGRPARHAAQTIYPAV